MHPCRVVGRSFGCLDRISFDSFQGRPTSISFIRRYIATYKLRALSRPLRAYLVLTPRCQQLQQPLNNMHRNSFRVHVKLGGLLSCNERIIA